MPSIGLELNDQVFYLLLSFCSKPDLEVHVSYEDQKLFKKNDLVVYVDTRKKVNHGQHIWRTWLLLSSRNTILE